jgi:hypothetical protein
VAKQVKQEFEIGVGRICRRDIEGRINRTERTEGTMNLPSRSFSPNDYARSVDDCFVVGSNDSVRAVNRDRTFNAILH